LVSGIPEHRSPGAVNLSFKSSKKLVSVAENSILGDGKIQNDLANFWLFLSFFVYTWIYL
jgi:hypothetical protein